MRAARSALALSGASAGRGCSPFFPANWARLPIPVSNASTESYLANVSLYGFRCDGRASNFVLSILPEASYNPTKYGAEPAAPLPDFCELSPVPPIFCPDWDVDPVLDPENREPPEPIALDEPPVALLDVLVPPSVEPPSP